MSKANILIVEDEFIISEDLSATLEECGYSVAGIAENVNEALDILNKKTVNLVLLDINLNQPVDGVQIAHIINSDYELPFIFVTAFSDKTTIEKVKHTKPYGYVTKPYNEIDMMITIDLALYKFKSEQELDTPLKNYNSGNYIFVKTKKGLQKINITEIRWIEAYDYYSFVQLEKEKILVTTTLKDLEQKINHIDFVRVHRKYTVNFNHINKVIGNWVEIDETLISVSRTHKEELLKRLNLI